jgi:hypothetical protein
VSITEFRGDRQSHRHCRSLLAIASLCALLVGCWGAGNSTGIASGEVRVDGAPVPRGYITFSPTGKEHGSVVGAPIENGKYRCEHIPVGKLTVTFVAQAAEPTTVYDVATKTNREIPKNILPPADETGRPAEITAGENHLDFDLKSAGK